MASDLSDLRRVLVVTKFRYLGDTIVATPFLRRLREAAPSADITLLTGPALPSLLSGCPWVSRVWTFAPDEPARLRRHAALVHRMRAAAFDAAFVVNRSFSAAALVAAARVPIRVGFATEHRGRLLTVRVPYDRARAEIECFLDLLRAVGQEAAYTLPQLWVTPSEREGARRSLGQPLRRPVVLVQPGARDAYRKQWPASGFVELVNGLARMRPGVSTVLIGGSEEATTCREVAEAVSAPVCNLGGKTNLREVLALVAEADLLVANDTALVHAAAGLGTPTVSVHGPSTARKWGYGGPHRVVTAPGDFARADRHANRRALDQLPPGPVLEAVLDALEARDRAEVAVRGNGVEVLQA